jgi:hypothetical protein
LVAGEGVGIAEAVGADAVTAVEGDVSADCGASAPQAVRVTTRRRLAAQQRFLRLSIPAT